GDAIRITLMTGELPLIRFSLGVIAALFTLLVWRGRSRIVAALIPEVLEQAASDEGLSPEEFQSLDFQALGKRLVIFGRRSMAKRLRLEITLLAKMRGMPKIDGRPVEKDGE